VSQLYTTELVNSYFRLCEHDYHHNRVDTDSLAAGTADVDETPVALYSHLVVGLSDLDNPCFVRYL